MEIKRIVGGMLFTNTYILFSQREITVIDPGADIEKIERELPEKRVDRVLLAHGHLDHIYFTDKLRNEYGAKVYIHEEDRSFLSDFALNSPGDFPKGLEKREYVADGTFSDGDIIAVGDTSCEVIHTPGHTPGGVCFYFEREKVLFSGDTVFKGTYGRTDFPSASEEVILRSIKKLFSKIPDDVRIYPGHGLSTVAAAEKPLYGF